MNFKKHLHRLETLFDVEFKPLTTSKRLALQKEIKERKVPTILDHYYDGRIICWTDIESLEMGWLWDTEEFVDQPDKLLNFLTSTALRYVKTYKKKSYIAEKDGSYILVHRENINFNKGYELSIFQLAFDCDI